MDLKRLLRYHPELPLYTGTDFGYRNPFANLWIQPVAGGEVLLVLDEYYKRWRTTEENALACFQRTAMRGWRITGGWADPSNPEGLTILSQVWGVKIEAPGLRNVEQGQKILNRWFGRRYEGIGCVQIHPRCKYLLGEINQYFTHEPGKGKHHSLDGLRYFVAGWDPEG